MDRQAHGVNGGGSGYVNASTTVHGWSVTPSAMAGMRRRERLWTPARQSWTVAVVTGDVGVAGADRRLGPS